MKGAGTKRALLFTSFSLPPPASPPPNCPSTLHHNCRWLVGGNSYTRLTPGLLLYAANWPQADSKTKTKLCFYFIYGRRRVAYTNLVPAHHKRMQNQRVHNHHCTQIVQPCVRLQSGGIVIAVPTRHRPTNSDNSLFVLVSVSHFWFLPWFQRCQLTARYIYIYIYRYLPPSPPPPLPPSISFPVFCCTRGCTSGLVYVHCIYTHSRWELP